MLRTVKLLTAAVAAVAALCLPASVALASHGPSVDAPSSVQVGECITASASATGGNTVELKIIDDNGTVLYDSSALDPSHSITVEFCPPAGTAFPLKVEATDSAGHAATATVDLQP